MKRRAQVALVMHAPLGTAFAACAEHVLGGPTPLRIYDVQADACPDLAATQLLQMLTPEAGQGTLILCDVYGATPFNVAARAARALREQGYAVRLVTGANLCMVLKALTESFPDLAQFSVSLLEGARKGIVEAEYT